MEKRTGRLRSLTRSLSAVAAAILAVSSIVQALPGQGGIQRPPGGVTSIPAGRAASNVAVITIHREIDAVMAASVRRRMELARAEGADAIVFDLNTPGGEVGAVLEICDLIKQSDITNTVAWIHNQAYSGGAIIALACREIIVADPATMGDAGLVSINSFGMYERLDEQARQKFTAPILAELVDSARRRGYDEKLVQGIATRGVELWLIQHPATGQRVFIDRAEHQLLFGTPPDHEPATLTSASSLTPAAPAPPAAGATPDADTPAPDAALDAIADPDAATEPAPEPQDPRAPTPSNAPGTDFIPATPALDPSITREISLVQTLATTRPVFTEADRGQWVKLEKVSDGQGFFTFRDRELLRYGLASTTVRNDAELDAFFNASTTVTLDVSWSEGMVSFLTKWYVRGVLVVLLVLGFFIEMIHPGLVFPATVGVIALVALIAPPFLNDMASWWEISAILLGLILLSLELFVIPGFGVPGVLGLLLLFGGLLGTFVGNSGSLFPDSPRQQHDLLYGVVTLLFSAATSSLGIYFIAKHFGSIPILNRLVLAANVENAAPPSDDDDDNSGILASLGDDPADIPVRPGDLGRAITTLRPAGRAQFGEHLLDVVAEFGIVDAGSAVRVTTADRFRIAVELAHADLTSPPVHDADPGSPGDATDPRDGGTTA